MPFRVLRNTGLLRLRLAMTLRDNMAVVARNAPTARDDAIQESLQKTGLLPPREARGRNDAYNNSRLVIEGVRRLENAVPPVARGGADQPCNRPLVCEDAAKLRL